MCDAYVGGSIQSEANTGAGLLDPDGLSQERSDDVLIRNAL